MHSVDTMAPWQIAPVSLTSRIASAALAVLSLDSVLLWSAAPKGLAAAALTIIPAIIAIRLIRGFAVAPAAAATFVAAQLGSLLYLLTSHAATSAQMMAALTVAILIAAAGLASLTAGWLASRRTPLIALTRTETRAAIRARNA